MRAYHRREERKERKRREKEEEREERYDCRNLYREKVEIVQSEDRVGRGGGAGWLKWHRPLHGTFSTRGKFV
jgi:hypothetical protein